MSDKPISFFCMSATIPVSFPADQVKEIESAATATGLSRQDVIRQSTKLGIPRLRDQLAVCNGRVTNVDPLSDEELARIYSAPDRDEEGTERLMKAQAWEGKD